jgi:copper chaperone CopZ
MNMENIVIGIAGMSCQNCVKSITGLLQALPGVEQAEVSLEAGQARLVFDPAKAGIAQFKDAIEGAGFDIT